MSGPLSGCGEDFADRWSEDLEASEVLIGFAPEVSRSNADAPGAFGEAPPSGPFAQIAANCNVDPRLPAPFPAPATLGNGLVYDSRAHAALGGPGTPSVEDVIADMRAQGFRPVQVDVKPRLLAGDVTWDDPVMTPTFIADEDANHPVETEIGQTLDEFNVDRLQREANGWRPLSLSPYALDPLDDDPDVRRYTTTWVQDGRDPDDTAYDWDLTFDTMWTTMQDLGALGYRPIAIESMIRGPDDPQKVYERRYALVMHRDEIGLQGDWTYTHQLDKHDLMLDIDDKAAEGYAPFYVTVRPHSPLSASGYSWTYGVIYAKSPSSTAFKFEVEPWLTATALQQKIVEYRGYGMHLVSVASHPDWDKEEQEFTAIWHRYDWLSPRANPVKMEGTVTQDGEAFLPLAQEVIAEMQANRIPAAQLAVAVGGELVLSHGYTWAPVAYRPITVSTPIMAGSITKSVTAVAALQAFGASGIEGDLMDLVPEPSMGSKPEGITVRQALQHRSGWDIQASALDVKEEINQGRMPRSEDWLEFMARLDEDDPAWGIDGSKVGNFNYSNFPYEMVAMALKTHAQLPPDDPANLYESSLMNVGVFDEVGMCRSAYKRQGLLDVEIAGMEKEFREPEYASCYTSNLCEEEPRFYLTEPGHPYQQDPSVDLQNPAMFWDSALDDAAAAPARVRRDTYGGANAIAAHIGAASLVSTAEDLVRYMVSFRPYLVDGLATTLLDVGEAAAMFPASGGEPGFQCTQNGRVIADGNYLRKCYGLGWFVGNEEFEDPEVWWHGGDVEGAVSALLYHPETDAIVAVLFARHPFSATAFAETKLVPALDAIAE